MAPFLCEDIKVLLANKIIIVLLISLVSISYAQLPPINDELIRKVEREYGEFAKRRVITWKKIITDNKTVDEMQKLEKVNAFFNQMAFVSDIYQWKKRD